MFMLICTGGLMVNAVLTNNHTNFYWISRANYRCVRLSSHIGDLPSGQIGSLEISGRSSCLVGRWVSISCLTVPELLQFRLSPTNMNFWDCGSRIFVGCYSFCGPASSVKVPEGKYLKMVFEML